MFSHLVLVGGVGVVENLLRLITRLLVANLCSEILFVSNLIGACLLVASLLIILPSVECLLVSFPFGVCLLVALLFLSILPGISSLSSYCGAYVLHLSSSSLFNVAYLLAVSLSW